MDLRYDERTTALRREIREFFGRACPPATREKLRLGRRLVRAEVVAWQRILNARGWAVPHWPVQWGGTGWSPIEQYVFTEELYLAPVPEPLAQNTKMVGPVIIAFGTEAQKRHFLPRIANLDDWFCQGFSEPQAGSDLSSLRTAARRDGDHYVVTGQKIWTTGARHADWMFCLVRTDPQARPQRGISFLLIDMRSPGVTVRPIRSIDGSIELSEVFLDEVRVPLEHRVGEENRGWDYAKHLLVAERTNIARVGLSKMRLRTAMRIASDVGPTGATLLDDPVFAQRLACAAAELKALELTQLRVLAARERSADALDPMSSVLKIRGSELQQLTAELMLDAAGPAGLVDDAAAVDGGEPADPLAPDWAPGVPATYLFSRAASIYGGSNEIQRNILARTVLGL